MLAYRQKGNLIHTLHPVTMLVFILSLFLLSLVFSHPAYLLGLFLAVGAVIIASDTAREWRSYMKLTLAMILLIVLINAVVGQAGSTPLVSGGRVPLLRHLRVTVEGLAYGAGMGLRLLVVISVFCLYTYAVHPDKILSLLSRWMTRATLVITLATRLFPLMIGDFYRITEVQRCRGVKFEGGRWWERAGNLIPVASVLLLSSLERSLLLAESMHARGFGSGTRSYYHRELWRPRDWLVMAGVMIGVITALVAVGRGWSYYMYYPRLAAITGKEVGLASVMTVMFSVPAVLAWGWKSWPWLRSKI